MMRAGHYVFRFITSTFIFLVLGVNMCSPAASIPRASSANTSWVTDTSNSAAASTIPRASSAHIFKVDNRSDSTPANNIPRSPSTPCFFNFSAEYNKARSLYAELKTIVVSGPQTKIDALAQAIFNMLDKKLIYQFNLQEISNPYEVQAVKKQIKLGPFDILPGLSRWNCMLLIDQNSFRFYLKEQQTLYELTTKQLSKIEDNPVCNEPYFIIFSTTCFYYQFKITEIYLKDESETGKFYYFCSHENLESKNAPFHHEAQPEASSALCGLHALNAYLGCRYLSPQTLSVYILPALRKAGSPLLTKTFDIKTFGLEPTLLKYVIDKIAHSGKVSGVKHEAKIIACSCKPTLLGDKFSDHENDFKEYFKRIDRFILGVAKTQAHFLAYRQDENGMWWKIDSQHSHQEAFENTSALIDEIKDVYQDDLLHFIIPDHNQKIVYAEKLIKT